jgi:hypothetical protein
VSIQWNAPLTLALSPSDGEREGLRLSNEQSLFCDRSARLRIFSLSPSDGERAGVRGCFECIVGLAERGGNNDLFHERTEGQIDGQQDALSNIL